MGKRTLMLLICVLSLGIILGIGNAQDDMEEIDNSVFENPSRPPVVFRHDEHNEKAAIDECNECHHVYEDGEKLEYESSEDQYCSDCHHIKESVDGKYHLRKAFHVNCKGCHLEKKIGPVMCGECHAKENEE